MPFFKLFPVYAAIPPGNFRQDALSADKEHCGIEIPKGHQEGLPHTFYRWQYNGFNNLPYLLQYLFVQTGRIV
ncbi:hypothetical protein ES708_22125 [subsurface metagenome]